MWQPVITAPFEQDLELAVIEDGLHVLIFPCRRTLVGWVKSDTRERLDISPTHWRAWRGEEATDQKA
jgi:hypothetical protein